MTDTDPLSGVPDCVVQLNSDCQGADEIVKRVGSQGGSELTNEGGAQEEHPTIPRPAVYQAAREMHAAGLNLIPVKMDGSKQPDSVLSGWQRYQHTRTTPLDHVMWWASGQHTGIAVIYGNVSGEAYCLELEGRAVAEGVLSELDELMAGNGLGDVWHTIKNGWADESPSGGVHYHIRVADGPAPRTQRLASRPKREDELDAGEQKVRGRHPNKTFAWCLVEIRGEGAYAIAAPSHGGVHPTGRPYVRVAGGPATMPVIDLATLRRVHDVCRMADRMPVRETYTPRPTPKIERPAGFVKPGEDFNIRADWADILLPHGWTLDSTMGQERRWTRPGKRRGVSAVTNHYGNDLLHVFTGSTDLEEGRTYTKFSVYAKLNHGHLPDSEAWRCATRELGLAGFGTPLENRYTPPPPPAPVAVPVPRAPQRAAEPPAEPPAAEPPNDADARWVPSWGEGEEGGFGESDTFFTGGIGIGTGTLPDVAPRPPAPAGPPPPDDTTPVGTAAAEQDTAAAAVRADEERGGEPATAPAASGGVPGDGDGWASVTGSPGDGGLPLVDITNERDGFNNLVKLIDAGGLPETYVRDGRLVHVGIISGARNGRRKKVDAAPERQAPDITPSQLRALIGRHVSTIAFGPKGQPRPKLPTETLCKAILSVTEWNNLPDLVEITRMPFMRADGSVCQKRGYDEDTGVWLNVDEGFPQVPADPTEEEIGEAKSFLLDRLLRNFPWVADSDRANYLALLLGPAMRRISDGLMPFGAITATTAGSGKSLLAETISRTYGGSGETNTLSRHDEEIRKTITSKLMSDPHTVVTFDNIGRNHPVDSPVLAQMLTTSVWSDRPLSTNDMISCVNDRLWLGTGNNIALGGDLKSRTVMVRIDPRMERPDRRDTTTFAIGDLKNWLTSQDNQIKIIHALMVLIRAWAAAGMPKKRVEMRSFNGWAQNVGGLLDHHGIPGFLDNADEADEADEEAYGWNQFLSAWHARHGDEWLTTSQLIASYRNSQFDVMSGAVDPWNGAFPIRDNGQPFTPHALGARLRHIAGRPFNGWVLGRKVDPATNQRLWRVDRVETEPPPAEYTQPTLDAEIGAGGAPGETAVDTPAPPAATTARAAEPTGERPARRTPPAGTEERGEAPPHHDRKRRTTDTPGDDDPPRHQAPPPHTE